MEKLANQLNLDIVHIREPLHRRANNLSVTPSPTNQQWGGLHP